MDKILLKLARQLNAYDEASLMSLWETYAEKVQQFEPTKRWEESAIIFGFIQAVRWKNQLFNYNWSESSRPMEAPDMNEPDPLVERLLNGKQQEDLADLTGEISGKGPTSGDTANKRAKVLRFRPREGDESV